MIKVWSFEVANSVGLAGAADSLPLQVDAHLDAIGDLNERNAAVHAVRDRTTLPHFVVTGDQVAKHRPGSGIPFVSLFVVLFLCVMLPELLISVARTIVKFLIQRPVSCQLLVRRSGHVA